MSAAAIVAGARILASAGRDALPQAVIKAVDEGRTVTTLSADAELQLPVVASATYVFACYLDYEGTTAGGGDLKYEWIVPTGAALRYSSIGKDTSGTVQVHATQKDTTVYALETNGNGTLVAAVMAGTLVTAAASGTLQLEWALNFNGALTTTVHAQSFLALWQLAP
jgi:hypothetical protein